MTGTATQCAIAAMPPAEHAFLLALPKLSFMSPQDGVERKHKLDNKVLKLQTQHGGNSQKEK